MDKTDMRIVDLLQEDCTQSVAEIGRQVGLSTTPCWRRIQKLEDDGVIMKRVALIDAQKVNMGVTVFVFISTSQHTRQWLERFRAVVEELPEIVEFYRMSGQVDYLLRLVVRDIAHYDAVYKRLIARIDLTDVSSSFAMEQIKFTTKIPLDHALESPEQP